MRLETKTAKGQFELKNADEGIAHILIGVFGNQDNDKDVLQSGAFSRTIRERKAADDLPPGLFAHDVKQPVAKTLDAYEDGEGVHVVGQFNLETQIGKDTFSNIKHGLIKRYSYGYVVQDKEYKGGARHIKDLDWHEWSPVVFGANGMTRTVAVKGGGWVEEKAQYLGNFAEESLAKMGVNHLFDKLSSYVGSQLYDGKNPYMANYGYYDGESPSNNSSSDPTPIDERLSNIEGALNEFRDMAMCHISAAMNSKDDTQLTKDYQALISMMSMPVVDFKAVTGYRSLPLAGRDRGWDAGAAVKRVKDWAGADDKPNAKFRGAFLWYDETKADEFTSYKFPYCDVVDGTLTAVPRAIFNAASRLGSASVPDDDKSKMRTVISKWYSKMRSEFDGFEAKPSWETGKGEKSAHVLGIGLSDEIDNFVDGAASLAERAITVQELRAADGRPLAEQARVKLKALREQLDTLELKLRPDASQDEIAQELVRFQHNMLRQRMEAANALRGE